MELLFTKNPDQKYGSSHDLENNRSILETTNAHKKRYRGDESIRKHNSKKYNEIIVPLFFDRSKKHKMTSDEKSGFGILPRHKIARKNSMLDYVYWDDPNELVDHLRLLIAKRSTGNQSHTNEIHSIIEELREAGYISTAERQKVGSRRPAEERPISSGG